MFIAQCSRVLVAVRGSRPRAIERVLAGVVEQVRVAVEPLYHLGAHRGLLAQPDCVQSTRMSADCTCSKMAPLIHLPPCSSYGPHAVRSHGQWPYDVDGDALARMISIERSARPVCGDLRRSLQGAVDVERTQIAEVQLFCEQSSSVLESSVTAPVVGSCAKLVMGVASPMSAARLAVPSRLVAVAHSAGRLSMIPTRHTGTYRCDWGFSSG